MSAEGPDEMTAMDTQARAIGALEGRMAGFQTTLESIQEESRSARIAQTARHDQVFARLEKATGDIGAVSTTVDVLAKAVEGDRALVDARFKSIWRWIAPAGGTGAVLAAAGWAWQVFAG